VSLLAGDESTLVLILKRLSDEVGLYVLVEAYINCICVPAEAKRSGFQDL